MFINYVIQKTDPDDTRFKFENPSCKYYTYDLRKLIWNFLLYKFGDYF